jgi:hypothetical protein
MKVIAQTVILSVFLIGTLGCQTPGVVLSEEQSPQCPGCKSITTTGPIKGTKNTEMHCPNCKTKYIDNSIGEYEDYTVIHSCSKCGINVKACEQCSKASK